MRHASTVLVPVVALLLFGGVGCVYRCESSLVASVSLGLEQPDGTPITDAVVRYSVNDGPVLDCQSNVPGSWVCGYEQDGLFLVTIDWNGARENLEYDVDATQCHVTTQVDTIVLTP